MPLPQTLTALLEAATAAAIEEEQAFERLDARVTWIEERAAALQAAQKRADEAWQRLVRMHPDEDEDVPDPPEQAELDAIFEELRAAAKEDKWPRKLHWSL